MATYAICTPKSLPAHQLESAARKAIDINPLNGPALHRLSALLPHRPPDTAFISVMTTKYWHTKGVRLGVGFLDSPPADLRARILSHMNAWSSRLNVNFVASSDPQVRIARTEGSGYWSYLGTDILSIAAGEPTMNLEAFTMETPDSEFIRVIRHETGHTIGCPHEHMRGELVEKIDRRKAIAYFLQTQGWSEQEVEQQVLTPIENGSLWGTGHADPHSIMCYQIPGTITKDGRPIVGGVDIDEQDFSFMEKVYPKPVSHTFAVNGSDLGMASGALEPAAQQESLARLRGDNAILRKALEVFARDQ